MAGGFDTKTVRENRYGLEGIRQRAKLLGGKSSIRSKSGEGTRVTVELPVVAREDDAYGRIASNRHAPRMDLFIKGGDIRLQRITGWKMRSIYAAP